MKKFTLLFVVALMVLANGRAFADLEWADPSLCVAGKWLVINAANAPGIVVTVPQGVAYGDQAAGGCATAAPAPLLPLSSVTVHGANNLKVMIDGKQASPVVNVSYGDKAMSRENDGGKLKYQFHIDHEAK
jgi:hypothetical protein